MHGLKIAHYYCVFNWWRQDVTTYVRTKVGEFQHEITTWLSLGKGGNILCVDSHLVEGVKRGEHHAFATIVRKYRPILVKFCYKQTKNIQISEDIVQESLTKSFFKIKSFEGRSSFKNWLFKITINTLRNKMRSRALTFISLDKLNYISVDSVSEVKLLEKQIQELLLSEMNLLPDKQQQALKLRVFEDLSFKEISEKMNCPYDTAKANYRHGLLKLRKRFETANELKGYRKFFTENFKKITRRFEFI